MKRSRHLQLMLLGTAPLALVACSSEPKEQDLTYESLDECISDGKATAPACSTAFREAEQIHVRQSPRYSDQSACAQGYGNCTRYTENGNSFWMPAMVGFLAGRWSAGSNHGGYIDTRGSYGYRPLYRTDDDRYRGTWSTSSSGGGTYSARTNSRSWEGSSSSGSGSSRISTSSVSRGGFGSSSSARGGWGGG